MVAQLDKEYVELSKERALKRFLSYLFFEGRPHTTKGQWFNPVVFALLRLLAKLPGDKSLNKPVFITGLGRSGTTVLGLIMSVHKDLGYLNEPKAAWRLVDEKTDTLDDYVAGMGQYQLKASDVSSTMREKARRIFARYLALIGRSRLLDKYPEHIFRVAYLLSVFPDAKIIFITRSGVDAIASIAKWSEVNTLEQGDSVEDWWGRNDAKWHYLCAQVLSLPAYQESLSGVDLQALDHVNRAALEWLVTMDAGIKARQEFPEQIVSVSYESLLSEPVEFFKNVFDFCELEHQQDVVDYAQSKIFQQRPRPMPELLPEIEQLFAATMKQLEYPYSKDS